MTDLAMAVVVREQQVLIQRRYRRSRGMVYEFPGGKIDAEESPISAAQRELNEETGLMANTCLGVHEGTTLQGGTICFVVLLAPTGQEPVATLAERRQSFYWMASEAIPLSDFAAADVLFIQGQLPLYLREQD